MTDAEFREFVLAKWPVKEAVVYDFWEKEYASNPRFLARMRENNRKRYETELAKREEVFKAAGRFADYPEAVRSLFLWTAGAMIEAELAKGPRAERMKAEFLEKYGVDYKRFAYRAWKRSNWEWKLRADRVAWVERYAENDAKVMAMTDDEKVGMFDDANRVEDAVEVAMAAKGERECLEWWAVKIGAVDEMIRKRMGGAPDGFELGARWGVGGYYNGVLVREGVRVSFKSFWAGGWNIQRAHIRVRLTELKARAGKEVA